MRTDFSTSCRCAVCGIRGRKLSQWFTADISCECITLSYASESTERRPTHLHFCSEAHAGQFLAAWLPCQAQAGDSQADPMAALPRSDTFRLRTVDPVIELSLSMAIEAFWEERVMEVE